MVFWAGIGPKQKSHLVYGISEALVRRREKPPWYTWALFSYKDGQLVRIATEEVPVALPDLKEAFIRRDTAEILPFQDHVLLFYDNNKLMSPINGFAAWNGKEFRTLLQQKNSFVLGGENHLLLGLFDWGWAGDGGMWMQLASKSELLYTIYDGVKMESRLSTKDKWPGTKIDVKLAYTTPVRRVRPNLFANGMLVLSGGGEIGYGLLRVQKDRTDVLVKDSDLQEAFGLKYPFAFEVLCVSGVDQFLLKASGKESIFGRLREALFFYRQGKLEKVFDPEQTEFEKHKHLEFFQGVAMEGKNPRFFFTAGPTWQEDTDISSVKKTVSRPALYWFDGQTVHSVAKGTVVRHDSLRTTETPLGKLLWAEVKPYLRLVVTDSGGGKKKIETDAPWQRQLITVSTSGVTLQDPPRFSLTNSQINFSLADVVGWISEKEALVLAEPGLYRLKRVE